MTKSCFSNISAHIHPSTMVQYSKRTFGCQVSNETDPNNGGFWFFEKSGKNHGAIFINTLKVSTMVSVGLLDFLSLLKKLWWNLCKEFQRKIEIIFREKKWNIFEIYLRYFSNEFWKDLKNLENMTNFEEILKQII